MNEQTEICVEFNHRIKGIENDCYIVSLYSISNDLLNTGINFLNFPNIFSTNTNESHHLLYEIRNQDSNFPSLDFDEDAELTRLINKLKSLNESYKCLKFENNDLANSVVELSRIYIIRVNTLLIKASTEDIKVLRKEKKK